MLDANPLDDITNTQRISKIYIKGVEVDRAALGRSLTERRGRRRTSRSSGHLAT